MPVLTHSFFMQDTTTVAQRLLGKRLVRKLDCGTVLSGIICETEAYLGSIDKASHTFGNRKTKRVASMYLPGGHAYIYFIYGMYYCLNVATRTTHQGEAVLIRSIIPDRGITIMRVNRAKAKIDANLCNGPGKLCQSLCINRDLDGHSLITGKSLWIEPFREVSHAEISVTPRIGIRCAGEWCDKPLRFLWTAQNDTSLLLSGVSNPHR